MKRIGSIAFLALLIALLVFGALPKTVYAASTSDIVIGNSYTLESGKTLNDNLFILGGSVYLMSGSSINGNVILIGGSLQAEGKVDGNITVLGGTINLAGTFVLNGNLTTVGAPVSQDPNAQINGQIHTGETTPYYVLPNGLRIPNMNTSLDPFFRVVGFFLRLFLWALVSMVVAMFIPANLTRTAQTILTQPLVSAGLGLLTIIIVPIVLVLLVLTICLIPVALIAAFLLIIAWAFGLIAIGLEVGRRISSIFKQEWHPTIAAGLGTLLLMTVLNGMDSIIPCIGWIPKVLLGFVGLGAVLLTQFGIRPYLPHSESPENNQAGIQPV